MSQQTGRRSCSRSFRTTRWWPSRTTKTTSGIKRSRRCSRLTTARQPLCVCLLYGDLVQNVPRCEQWCIRGWTATSSAPPNCDYYLVNILLYLMKGVDPVIARVCHLCGKQRLCSGVLVKCYFITPSYISFIDFLSPTLSLSDEEKTLEGAQVQVPWIL